MNDDLKRRILFFSLPVMLAAGVHAILIAMTGEPSMSFIAGTIAGIAAFFIGFRYLDDRGAIILEDWVHKPAIGLSVGLLSAGIVWPAAVPGMVAMMLVLLGGFAGVTCFTSYLDLTRAITPSEKMNMMGAVGCQMAMLTLALTSATAAIPATVAGLMLAVAVSVRFWRVQAPLTDAVSPR